MSGRELETELYVQYNIQVEFSNCNHILIVGSHGDSAQGLQRLICALRGIASEIRAWHCEGKAFGIPEVPQSAVTLGNTFFSDKCTIPFQDREGAASAEFIISYLPGIPILCPGEVITRPVIDYCNRLLKANMTMTGMASCNHETIQVLCADTETLKRGRT
ncbi:MAG: hypothetical protein RR475_12015 [Clostridia bacterium]